MCIAARNIKNFVGETYKNDENDNHNREKLRLFLVILEEGGQLEPVTE